MDILYIDVYFLLNFTIDVLAAFFSSKLMTLRTNLWALLAVGALGSVSAIIDVFLDAWYLRLINSIVFLAVISIVIRRGLAFTRRLKFILAYFVVELIFGGVISYLYGVLDRYFADVLDGFSSGATNRTALVFSLIILLSIGVLRIIIMLFSGNTNGRCAVVKIELEDRVVECEALLDSGNLVKDPMSMCPVLFIKEAFAASFLPTAVIDLDGIDSLGYGYKKRLRLIPVTRNGTTHVMTGIRADGVYVKHGEEFIETDMTIVIDKEGGDFGGYLALAPSVVLD